VSCSALTLLVGRHEGHQAENFIPVILAGCSLDGLWGTGLTFSVSRKKNRPAKQKRNKVSIGLYGWHNGQQNGA